MGVGFFYGDVFLTVLEIPSRRVRASVESGIAAATLKLDGIGRNGYSYVMPIIGL